MARLMLDSAFRTDSSLPDLAITDGSHSPKIIDVCIVGYDLRCLRVRIPVDTGAISRIRRYEAMRRSVALLAALGMVFSVLLLVSACGAPSWLPDTRLLAVVSLLSVVLMVAMVSWTLSARPSYYPQLVDGRSILIEDVDADAANAWAALNPVGVIRVAV